MCGLVMLLSGVDNDGGMLVADGRIYFVSDRKYVLAFIDEKKN